jgi:hypothetical protein
MRTEIDNNVEFYDDNISLGIYPAKQNGAVVLHLIKEREDGEDHIQGEVSERQLILALQALLDQ